MTKSCIFCDIANRKTADSEIEFDNDEIVIIKDIKPASKYHFLAITKVHYDSVKSLDKEHANLLINMERCLKELLQTKNVENTDTLFGFHYPPFISVSHLHMHAIAPTSTMSLKHKFMFKPNTYWFKTVDNVRRMLEEKA